MDYCFLVPHNAKTIRVLAINHGTFLYLPWESLKVLRNFETTITGNVALTTRQLGNLKEFFRHFLLQWFLVHWDRHSVK